MTNRRVSRPSLSLSAFASDRRGSSAVEFAIVSIPFIFVVLFIIQMGIYYAAQSSLNAGVIQAADSLTNTFNSNTTPTMTQAQLQSLVYSKSGGLIHNDSTLKVELVEMSTLSAAIVPINGTVVAISSGAIRDVLALRAQASIVTFMPGFSPLAVIRSTALLRRQGT